MILHSSARYEAWIMSKLHDNLEILNGEVSTS